MNLFKTEVLKKEYKEFIEKILPSVLECNFCNIKSCIYHSKCNVSCLHCRKRQCKNCRQFNISKDILLNSASKETVDYLYNFICDFFNLSDESIKTFFPEVNIEHIEKKEVAIYSKRVKSEKNRTQVVNCKLTSGVISGTYQNGRWKRRFFYKR